MSLSLRTAMLGRTVTVSVCVATAIAVLFTARPGYTGVSFRGGAVGGVSISAEGVLSNPTTSDLQELQAAWQAGLENIPADLDQPTELRFLSLRGLEAEIAKYREKLLPLPDAVKYLAGLQRVTYVLVYPDRGDIVLAGPAEGWRIDSLGNVVGITTGQPVLTLDDLMVALRSADTTNETGISCSIDPTDQGVKNAQNLQQRLRAGTTPQVASQKLEEVLGDQIITVTGIPLTSHFARVIVAADFRMKRLAMNFQPAPIDGMPSYLHIASKSRKRSQNMLPRWWLAADYESILRDPQGLVWQLRGQGVKCLTEQDLVEADGQRKQTGQVEPAAQKWAETFTARFPELAREDSTFGQLRNVMDLAIVGALLAKENLYQKAGLKIPRLLDDETVATYHAPRRVASQASFVKQRGGWLISASGGMQLDPWFLADQTEISQNLKEQHTEGVHLANNRWWWNGKQ